MVTIIHGDDINLSRIAYQKIRSEVPNKVDFEGEKITLTNLVQSLEGGNLFESEKNIFVENFFTKTKAGKETEKIINYLKKCKENIYFWESKILTKKHLSLFPKAILKTFKIPQSLFLFLDSLRPNENQKIISLFHQALEINDPEMIFFMLIRQFRLLIALKDARSTEMIDEVKYLTLWQASKLKKQASFFSDKKLRNIYSRLLAIDLSQKTGRSAFSLTQQLDFFLLEI